MATIRKRPNGTFELRVVHKSLGKPYYSTHDTKLDAEGYAAKLVDALDRGLLPPELVPKPVEVRLSVVLSDYLRRGRVAPSDEPMVVWLQQNLDMTIQAVTVRWTDAWVLSMKQKEHLAPGTIRKRVESLARAVDWWIRDTGVNQINPLRSLPRGYASYGEGEAPKGKESRVDVKRDRRLLPGEEQRIESAILGVKRPDRQRPLLMPDRADFLLLFRLILNTGLRLREAYSLRWKDVQLDLRTIRVDTSKTARGRDVPMLPTVHEWFLQTCSEISREPESRVFGFYKHPLEDPTKVTRRLSSRFATTFEYAGCEDLTEHDLRHEATIRWMLMRDGSGRWLFRPEEVRRITGHENVQMFERYFSLRGSDLAERLWDGEQGAAARA